MTKKHELTDSERAELENLSAPFLEATSAELDRLGVEHGRVWAEYRIQVRDGMRFPYATVGWGEPMVSSSNLTVEALRLAARGNYLWDGDRLDTTGLARRILTRAIDAGHLSPRSAPVGPTAAL